MLFRKILSVVLEYEVLIFDPNGGLRSPGVVRVLEQL